MKAAAFALAVVASLAATACRKAPVDSALPMTHEDRPISERVAQYGNPSQLPTRSLYDYSIVAQRELSALVGKSLYTELAQADVVQRGNTAFLEGRPASSDYAQNLLRLRLTEDQVRQIVASTTNVDSQLRPRLVVFTLDDILAPRVELRSEIDFGGSVEDTTASIAFDNRSPLVLVGTLVHSELLSWEDAAKSR